MYQKIINFLTSLFKSPKALEALDTTESIVLEVLNADTDYEAACEKLREVQEDPDYVWGVRKVVDDYHSSKERLVQARDRFLRLLRTIERKDSKSPLEEEVLKLAKFWIHDNDHYESLCLEYAKYEIQDVENRIWNNAKGRAILLEQMYYALGNKESTHKALRRLVSLG
jgi:hypothetical protein